jgi:hypothetical protein
LVATSRRSSSRRSAATKEFEGIDADYSDVDYREAELYDGPEPGRGIYRLELIAVGKHVKQGEDGDGDSTSTKWTFRIMDGEKNKHDEDVSGWRGSKYTNSGAAGFVEQNIAVALGLIKPKGKLRMSYAEILKKAKPCRAMLVPERYIPEDGEPEWRTSITASFLPDNGPKADAKDEDDEDDEAPPTRARRSRKSDPEPEEEPEAEVEDEDEGDDEPYDIDELGAELEKLSLADLKARAKEEFEITPKRGEKADDLIDRILDQVEAEQDEQPEEDEPEPEPEPEPAKPARRARGAAAKSSGRSKRGGFAEEPPF